MIRCSASLLAFAVALVFIASAPLRAHAAELTSGSAACGAEDDLLSLAPCSANEGAQGEACATLIEDLSLLVVVGSPDLEAGDCAPSELLPDLDCESPEATTTPWIAGILGLCDAPFGLLPRHGNRIRLAFLAGPVPANPDAPYPTAPTGDHLVGSVPPCSIPAAPHSRATYHPPLEVALTEPALQPTVGFRRLAGNGCAEGGVRPGHARRVERPPRAH